MVRERSVKGSDGKEANRSDGKMVTVLLTASYISRMRAHTHTHTQTRCVCGGRCQLGKTNVVSWSVWRKTIMQFCEVSSANATQNPAMYVCMYTFNTSARVCVCVSPALAGSGS